MSSWRRRIPCVKASSVTPLFVAPQSLTFSWHGVYVMAASVSPIARCTYNRRTVNDRWRAVRAMLGAVTRRVARRGPQASTGVSASVGCRTRSGTSGGFDYLAGTTQPGAHPGHAGHGRSNGGVTHPCFAIGVGQSSHMSSAVCGGTARSSLSRWRCRSAWMRSIRSPVAMSSGISVRRCFTVRSRSKR